jgi:hypothetical protein
MTTYAVLPLAASSYKTLTSCLTHLVAIEGTVPQCRVKPEHVLDDMCEASHVGPTCKTCAKKLAKLGLVPSMIDGDKVWVAPV